MMLQKILPVPFRVQELLGTLYGPLTWKAELKLLSWALGWGLLDPQVRERSSRRMRSWINYLLI